VGDALFLEMAEPGEQVFGEAALRVGLGRGVRGEPLAQVLAADALHDQGQSTLDHLGEVDDLDDVGVIEGGERLILAAQGVLGGVLGRRDLERAQATTDEVARGVDDRHAALAEAPLDLVVGADPGAGLEVLGVEPGLSFGGDRGERAGFGIAPVPDGDDRLRERGVAIGRAELDHPRDGLVEAERDLTRHVADPPHETTRRDQMASAVEQRLAGQQQGEDGAEAELVGGRLGAAEGRDDLRRGHDQAVVRDDGDSDCGFGCELLGEVEPGDPNLSRLGTIFDEDDVRAEEPVNDTLTVCVLERLRETDPQVRARVQIRLHLAARVGSVALDPGGQRDPGEALEGEDDPGLVGEGRVCAEDPLAAAKAAEDLGLPASPFGDAVALPVRGERRDAVDTQDALGRR
jgi:hypothetical protein